MTYISSVLNYGYPIAAPLFRVRGGIRVGVAGFSHGYGHGHGGAPVAIHLITIVCRPGLSSGSIWGSGSGLGLGLGLGSLLYGGGVYGSTFMPQHGLGLGSLLGLGWGSAWISSRGHARLSTWYIFRAPASHHATTSCLGLGLGLG